MVPELLARDNFLDERGESAILLKAGQHVAD